MVRVTSSKSVNIPQETIFSVIKDVSKLPTLFPDKYKAFKIVKQSDKYILTEEILSISGKEIKIDADIKFGKIGAIFGVFAKHKLKTEMDKLIDQFTIQE